MGRYGRAIARSYQIAKRVYPYAKGAVRLGRTLYSRVTRSRKRRRSSSSNWPSASQASPVPRMLRERKWKGVSTGRYRGRFGRKKVRMYDETKTATFGFHNTTETYGAIDDPHCVYITHSTTNFEMYTNVIVGALVRKLLKKGGIDVDSLGDSLSLETNNKNLGWRIELVTVQPQTGVRTVAQFTLPDVCSMDTLVSQFGPLRASIGAQLTNIANAAVPMQLNLLQEDNGSVTLNRTQTIAILNLTNQVVHMYCEAEIVVQNRTAGAAAASGDLSVDRIDNQPVSGIMYEFKTGDPRLRQAPRGDIQAGFNCITRAGVNLVRSASLNAEYQEPPVPREFKGVVKATKVILQPGDMKKSVIRVKYTKKLPELLDHLKAGHLFGPFDIDQRYSMVAGKCQLFVMEEKIRTTVGNPVTLQYQVQHKIGAYCTEGRPAPLKTKFAGFEINQLGP